MTTASEQVPAMEPQVLTEKGDSAIGGHRDRADSIESIAARFLKQQQQDTLVEVKEEIQQPQAEAGTAANDSQQASLEKVCLSPKSGKCQGEAAAEMATNEPYEATKMMKFLLCSVAALEGADNLLMPVTMFALQKYAGIKFTDLIYLGGMQAVCSNIAGPLWGMFADRGTISRRNILMIGSLGQGVVTVFLAFITSLTPMIILRGLNGIMLASLRPISNGVVADTTSDSLRGKVFGQVQSAMVFGMLFTAVVATPIANLTVFGIRGWRIAFVLIGSLSLVVCALLKLFFVNPAVADGGPDEVSTTTETVPNHSASTTSVREARASCRVVMEEIGSVLRFAKIPTFTVMILQGIFGTIPWAALGNMTLFFQLSGMTDIQAAALQTEQLVVGIFGNLLGGYVADALAARFGYHGRPLNAQFTVAVGMPLIYLMFWAIPPGHGEFWAYALLILAWSLFGCWAQSGTNFPILCEIVPAEARCRILAWECCLENTMASALAPPIIANVAVAFGYKFGQDADEGQELESAVALGKSMTLIVVLPGLVCFSAYSMLHYTYPRDVKRLKALTAAASAAKVQSEAMEEVVNL
jgi:MFS family permease